MARVARFADHRFVGDRSTMIVFDTDDASESAELVALIEIGALMAKKLLQTFGPDTIEEARNRGFTPR